MRHFASAGRNYDKKSDFTSPDPRGGSVRTAAHRYLSERSLPISEPSRAHGPADAASDLGDFSDADFKARWWPAPDAWQ
jgi:hypothetical protein